jgi:hypothetical protein
MEPSSASMGKFFANRMRDSYYLGSSSHVIPTIIDEDDPTAVDPFAMPEPTVISNDDEPYFTQSTRDTHKFSRRVELSSGYNILKNRTNTRPMRLPSFLQGHRPLMPLNPLNTSDEQIQRRLSFTDHQRSQIAAFKQKISPHFNTDGTRRPFSSDSPLPSNMPVLASSTMKHGHTSSAPPAHSRVAHETVEFLRVSSENEDNSIAALSRELRAAAYPTTRKSIHHSPTRDTSPSSARFTARANGKRAPPRSLPKLNGNESTVTLPKIKAPHSHNTPSERQLSLQEDSTTTSLLLDQFFSNDIGPAHHEDHAVANDTTSKNVSIEPSR